MGDGWLYLAPWATAASIQMRACSFCLPFQEAGETELAATRYGVHLHERECEPPHLAGLLLPEVELMFAKLHPF